MYQFSLFHKSVTAEIRYPLAHIWCIRFNLKYNAWTMQQTIRLIVRLCLAAIIFAITAALILTCLSKSIEIAQSEQNFAQAKKIHLQSSDKEQLVLLSNNKSPEEAVYIAIAQNGYIAKSNCSHYPEICIDDYNQQHTRQIQNIDLLHAGQFHYIQQVRYTDSRTQAPKTLNYSAEQIQQFYRADVSSLKYTLFGIGLFALAAMYVSIRILRNFKTFLGK